MHHSVRSHPTRRVERPAGDRFEGAPLYSGVKTKEAMISGIDGVLLHEGGPEGAEMDPSELEVAAHAMQALEPTYSTELFETAR